MNTNEFLAKFKEIKRTELSDGCVSVMRKLAPRMVLGDRTTLSAQVGETHYCTPRSSDAWSYTRVEVGYPSAPLPEEFDEYTDSDRKIYGYVPMRVLDKYIEEHGGIVGTETFVEDPSGGKAISVITMFPKE